MEGRSPAISVKSRLVKKKKEEKASKADQITKQLLEKVGIDFKPVAAEMGSKRSKIHFVPTA